MAALLFAINHGQRRPRVFRQRMVDVDHLSDREVVERYRLTRGCIEDLYQELRPYISPNTDRSQPIDPYTKTLVTLRYLAKGDFFSEAGDIHGISRSSVSRCVSTVIAAINRRVNNIRFPVEDDAVQLLKRQFYEIAGIPNVVGAIDGTLVPIIAPAGLDEPTYVCRKGYHALNVQAVVGPDMRFTDVVSKWPGSQHDSAIFESSSLKHHMERVNNGWLLGDSGYALKTYMITPKPRPATQPERRFNTAHSRTRIVVERAFGLLKSRFRCLHKTGGCLHFKPEKAAQVIVACMKLHNMCLTYGVPEPDMEEDPIIDDQEHVYQGPENIRACHIRQQLINNFDR